jgi:hypothetical protein
LKDPSVFGYQSDKVASCKTLWFDPEIISAIHVIVTYPILHFRYILFDIVATSINRNVSFSCIIAFATSMIVAGTEIQPLVYAVDFTQP